MGSGGSSRYKKNQPNENDVWRKPKQSKKSKTSVQEEPPSAAVASVPQAWRLAQQPVASPAPPPGGRPATLRPTAPTSSSTQAGDTGSRSRPGSSQAIPSLDDDDEDVEDFGNLADAAAKVWDELMTEKRGQRADDKEFKALLHLSELKDSVERAAKRAEALRREVATAQSKVTLRQAALEELCGRIEERALPSSGSEARWKLGDFAVRRGKGICELSTVHHEADPPYFEVRMILTGTVAGTEANNLVPLTQAQQAMARGAMKEFEQAKTNLTQAEESAAQAGEELKQRHVDLTAQVEKKLQGSASPTSASTGSAGAGSLNNSSGSKPPGLPDMGLMKKWGSSKRAGGGPFATPPGTAAMSSPAGADAGLAGHEGVRDGPRAPGGPPPSQGGLPVATEACQAPSSAAVPAAVSAPVSAAPSARGVAPTAPAGFPSFGDLRKLDQQAAAREQQQGQAQVYPGPHQASAREDLGRVDGGIAESPALNPQDQRPTRRSTPGSQDVGPLLPPPTTAPAPAVGMHQSGGAGKDGPRGLRRGDGGGLDAPAGFPRLDPSSKQGPRRSGGIFQAGAQEAQADAQAQAQAQARAQAQAQAEAEAQAQARAQAQAAQAQAQAAQRSQPQTDWVGYRTAEGQPYYHNQRTGETAWTLPLGAVCRDGMIPTQDQSAASQAQQQEVPQAQAQAQADDPFAGLRRQEEEMNQQREQWANWYQQYSTWYQQTSAQAQGGPPGAPPTGARGPQAAPRFGTGPGTGADNQSGGERAYVPPQGPQPPKLDANFEDHAMFAIKSSILKEMESMVEQHAPAAQRKKALRCLQIRWHPDKNPDKIEAAKMVFQFIEETKGWFLYDAEGEDGGLGATQS
eukprot:TRINITY_DN28579_c0_g1_i1.p1 TRINITY_DN28579_c0_g1~~TRINITY_DN28579_c0_g1_i1.p1  ORF type:complete len:858 (+),score=164.19 TRINITY_DN28579_c0_g1_i1:189-2762(+)